MFNINTQYIIADTSDYYRIFLRRVKDEEFYIRGTLDIIYVMRGSINIEAYGENLNLEQGNIYILGENKPIVASSEEDNRLLILQLDTNTINKKYDILESNIYEGLVVNEDMKYDLKIIMGLFLKFKFYKEELEISIWKLINKLFKTISLEKSNKGIVKNHRSKIEDTIIDITLEIPEMLLQRKNINLRDIADSNNISYYYLSKKFKEVTKMNFVDYVKKIQIGLFLDHLVNTDEKIIDIAYNIGYRNISNLNREFKNVFNRTPTEVRRIFKTIDFNDIPAYDITEVKELIYEVSNLENKFLKEEVVIDYTNTGLTSVKNLNKIDLEMSFIKLEKTLKELNNEIVTFIINLRDYNYIITELEEDKRLLIFSFIKKISSYAVRNSMEIKINLK